MKKLIIAGALAALCALAVASPASATGNEGKVYVCKYVGTPGPDERLQTGQNPIEVSVNSIEAITGQTPQVGDSFVDQHGRSQVVGIVPTDPEPTCSGTTQDPETTTTTKPDWGPIPEGKFEGCSLLLDPTSYVLMRAFNLTVDGVAVEYDETMPHGAGWAVFDLSGVPELQVPGDHAATADATWNIGTGTLHIVGTVHCVDETTTTAPPVVTVAPPSAPSQPAATPVTPEESSTTLPFTGAETLVLLGIGVAATVAGLLLRKPRIAA